MQYILGGYKKTYELEHTKLFCQKLGLKFEINNLQAEKELVGLLMGAFFASSADFTQAFRDMSDTQIDAWMTTPKWGLKKLAKVKKFKNFIKSYEDRLKVEEISEAERMQRMQQANPRYILRNWMAQRAIEKGT